MNRFFGPSSLSPCRVPRLRWEQRTRGPQVLRRCFFWRGCRCARSIREGGDTAVDYRHSERGSHSSSPHGIQPQPVQQRRQVSRSRCFVCAGNGRKKRVWCETQEVKITSPQTFFLHTFFSKYYCRSCRKYGESRRTILNKSSTSTHCFALSASCWSIRRGKREHGSTHGHRRQPIVLRAIN